MRKNCCYHTTTRILIGMCLLFATTLAKADDFAALQKDAKGQTVYFNAWGGDAKINKYISWAGKVLFERHGIKLVHVKLTETCLLYTSDAADE